MPIRYHISELLQSRRPIHSTSINMMMDAFNQFSNSVSGCFQLGIHFNNCRSLDSIAIIVSGDQVLKLVTKTKDILFSISFENQLNILLSFTRVLVPEPVESCFHFDRRGSAEKRLISEFCPHQSMMRSKTEIGFENQKTTFVTKRPNMLPLQANNIARERERETD